MTKADLIEEVSRVVEMTRKESEVIVEAIFDSIVRSCATATRSKSADSEASEPASASRAWAAIRRPGRASKCPRRRFRTSSPAKS